MTEPHRQTYRLCLAPQGGFSDLRHDNRRGIHLDRHQTHAFRGIPPLKAVICLQGKIWITQERDLQDYLLGPGDIFIVTLPGRMVVLALEPSWIEVIDNLTPIINRGSYEQSIRR